MLSTPKRKFHRSFVYVSVVLTSLGCFFAVISLFSSRWQIFDISEANSLHEHGILYDCVSSHNIPITAPLGVLYHHKCFAKFDSITKKQINEAVQDKYATTSREILLHRFLPHHRAILFFTIFAVIFGKIGIIIGLCSPCFVPNSLLHVVSTTISASCLVMADTSFIVHTLSNNSQNLTGIQFIYTQTLGYASYFHIFSSILVILGCIFAVVGAYICFLHEYQNGHFCCIVFGKREQDKHLHLPSTNHPIYQPMPSNYQPMISNYQPMSSNSSSGQESPYENGCCVNEVPSKEDLCVEAGDSSGYQGKNIIMLDYRPTKIIKKMCDDASETNI